MGSDRMSKMLGKFGRRCCYGCCRNSGRKGYPQERRMLKRQERASWKREQKREVF